MFPCSMQFAVFESVLEPVLRKALRPRAVHSSPSYIACSSRSDKSGRQDGADPLEDSPFVRFRGFVFEN